MATPIAAGSAALIQQYFQEGWYPTGAKSLLHQWKPSGALMKAVLLGAASNMQVSARAVWEPVLSDSNGQ